jgi:hypothetical protein
MLCTRLDLNYPLAFKLTHYICSQLLNLMWTFFFICSNGGGWITSYDTIWNAFCLHHEKCEVSCFMWTNSGPSIAFPSIFSPRGWHPVISDGVHTLANVVIVNPIQTNLVLHVASFHKVTLTMLVQAKVLYHNWCIIDVFLPLVECYLHQQIDNFFHWWANMACLTKGIKFPISFSFWIFVM